MNEAELAQRLGEALRFYSYQVANGAVSPFRSMLNGDEAVVSVKFKDVYRVAVKEAVMPNLEGCEAEIKALKAQVKKKNEEIKALNAQLVDIGSVMEISEEVEP